MTGALDRVAAFLVESSAPKASASLPGACRATVLGAVTDVMPLAAALALTLRAADRRAAALVALWGAALPGAAPALRAAAKLAAAVTPFAPASDECASAPTDRAIARGRLAWLALPAEPAVAVDALIGAAAVVDTPLVTAFAGVRPAALDALVAGHDLVVVAAAPGSPLAETAIERLAERGVPAVACRPPTRGVVRRLALAGWGSPRLDLGGEHEVVR